MNVESFGMKNRFPCQCASRLIQRVLVIWPWRIVSGLLSSLNNGESGLDPLWHVQRHAQGKTRNISWEWVASMKNQMMLLLHPGYPGFISRTVALLMESSRTLTVLEIEQFFLSWQVPTQFVESMLQVHSKFTELIKAVFNSDQQFVGALDKVQSVVH